MSDKHHTPMGELSYYKLSLLSYLKDSHPELASDGEFIAGRADRAAETYSRRISAGGNHVEAAAEASEELFRGLHFSLYNTLVNILWSEFATEIPEDAARRVALLMLPVCNAIVAKYDIKDDFATTSQYNLLYTELVGTVQILLEDVIQ